MSKKKNKKRRIRPLKDTWIEKTIKRLPKIFVGVAVLAFAAFCYPYVAGLLFRDIAKIDDSDLYWEDLTIPTEQNAFHFDAELRKVVAEPATPQISLTKLIESTIPWNQNAVRKITEQNVRTCEIVIEASKLPYFQDTALMDRRGVQIIAHQEVSLAWRKAGRICALRAIELVHQGKIHEGVTLATNVALLGDLIEHAQTQTTGYLLGASIKLFGLSALRTIAEHAVITAEDSKRVAMVLDRFSSDINSVIKPLKSEYLAQAQGIDNIKNGQTQLLANVGLDAYISKVDLPFYFQPNRTKQDIANVYRWIIKGTALSCVDYEPLLYHRNVNLPSKTSAYFTQNIVGKLIHDYAITPSTTFIEKRCNDELNNEMTQLILGLSAYKNANGSYPENLSQLVPTFLPSMPLDPYSGKEFRYDKEMRVVASIGPKTEKGSDGVFRHDSSGLDFTLRK